MTRRTWERVQDGATTVAGFSILATGALAGTGNIMAALGAIGFGVASGVLTVWSGVCGHGHFDIGGNNDGR